MADDVSDRLDMFRSLTLSYFLQQIETINKIFWSIEDLSEKEIKSYKVGKEIVSKPFEIAIGDIISKW